MSPKPTNGAYERNIEGASQEFQLETRHLALLVLIVVVLCLGSFQLGRWVERRSGGPSIAGAGSAMDEVSDANVDDVGDISRELTFFDSLKEDTVVDDAPVRTRSETGAAPPPATRRSVNEGIMIQVFASKDRSAAQAVRNRLREKGYTAFILSSDGTHKVRVGPYADKEEAELQAAIIREREDLRTWIP